MSNPSSTTIENYPASAQAAADLALMRRVAANDEVAVGQLYDRFGSIVYRLCYAALENNAEKAEEKTQSIFAFLWRRAGRFHPNRNTLEVFIIRTARGYLVPQQEREKPRSARLEALRNNGHVK